MRVRAQLTHGELRCEQERLQVQLCKGGGRQGCHTARSHASVSAANIGASRASGGMADEPYAALRERTKGLQTCGSTRAPFIK